MRTMALSLGGATVLGAAIIWAPLPSSFFGAGEPPGSPRRIAAVAVIAPSQIQPSRAASLLSFASDSAGGAVAAQKPAPPVLVGVVGSASRRIAYVLYAGQTARAGLWDKVGPWRVTAIGPRGVTLGGGRRPIALAFYGPRPQPPPAPLATADGAGSAEPPPAPSPPVVAHALEPASAPPPGPSPSGRRRYWSGPPGSAPPGFIQLKPGEIPPR